MDDENARANAPHQATLLSAAPDMSDNDPAPAAIGQFDGSADPNPGGRMGMGWHITLLDGQSLDGASEAPAQPGNTNNRAEYLALIALLEQYQQQGNDSQLLVRGDSQLVIQQMLGRWRVRDPMLRQLYAEARQVAARITGGVRFEWVPRDQNRRADSLASGEPQGDSQEQTPLPIYATAPLTSNISPALAQQIEAMNARGFASFKQYAALRVGGRDACSELTWNQLTTHAGADATRYCTDAFPQDARARATALRWVARGLAAHLAVKKVQCDQAMMVKRQQTEP